jgi:hypothetical protein
MIMRASEWSGASRVATAIHEEIRRTRQQHNARDLLLTGQIGRHSSSLRVTAERDAFPIRTVASQVRRPPFTRMLAIQVLKQLHQPIDDRFLRPVVDRC